MPYGRLVSYANIIIEPQELGPGLKRHIEEQVVTKHEGKLDAVTGNYTIAVDDASVTVLDKPKIQDGTCRCIAKAAFESVVFRPIKNEVYNITVTKVNLLGVLGKFGPLQVYVGKSELEDEFNLSYVKEGVNGGASPDEAGARCWRSKKDAGRMIVAGGKLCVRLTGVSVDETAAAKLGTSNSNGGFTALGQSEESVAALSDNGVFVYKSVGSIAGGTEVGSQSCLDRYSGVHKVTLPGVAQPTNPSVDPTGLQDDMDLDDEDDDADADVAGGRRQVATHWGMENVGAVANSSFLGPVLDDGITGRARADVNQGWITSLANESTDAGRDGFGRKLGGNATRGRDGDDVDRLANVADDEIFDAAIGGVDLDSGRKAAANLRRQQRMAQIRRGGAGVGTGGGAAAGGGVYGLMGNRGAGSMSGSASSGDGSADASIHDQPARKRARGGDNTDGYGGQGSAGAAMGEQTVNGLGFGGYAAGGAETPGGR